MNTEIDNITINLNVLSNLEQNKKIITKESYLNVEKQSYIPEGIRRTWRGDSRNETVKKIEMIINKAIELKEENCQLGFLLQNSKKGIKNLKETYSDCTQTKARLDSILQKIDLAFNDNDREI